MRALVIEDDNMIGLGLKRGLMNSGIAADWVKAGASGLEALAATHYGVVLLDLGLPDKQGFDVLTAMRGGRDTTPVLIVTARDDVLSRIKGLDLGADDYVVKPFDLNELAARIRAVLRRHAGQASARIERGGLTLDLSTHAASYRDVTHILSAREFSLLRALAERADSILSRDQLEGQLYGWGDEVESNAVDVLIYSIRKKFDKTIIRNVRGVGWTIPRTAW